MHLLLSVWTLTYLTVPNQAIIGYDCTGAQLKTKTISTIDVAPCSISSEQKAKVVTENIVQLLQYNAFEFTEVKQCKISVSRTIYECHGSFWYFLTQKLWTDVMPAGYRSFIYDIPEEECIKAHENGSVVLTGLNNYRLENIQNNMRDREYEVMLAGEMEEENKNCRAAYYEDPYTRMGDVVVKAIITVSMSKHIGKVSVEDDAIYLQPRTECKFSLGTCRDPYDGSNFWATVPSNSNCQETGKYSVIHYGKAYVSTLDGEELYIIEDSLTTFSLLKKGTIEICYEQFIQTEHPKLFIHTGNVNNFGFSKHKNENDNIFTYIDSKFLYVERYLRRQLESLHNDFRKAKCELERKMMKNRLSIAVIGPIEFAYRYMGGPGYIAVKAGEVIHIVRCNAVELEIRQTDKCYEYLPVKLKVPSHSEDRKYLASIELFITPQKHILSSHSKEISCNKPLPQCWLVDGVWIQYTPDGNKAEIPALLRPANDSGWTYKPPANLVSVGLYSQKDLDEMGQRIMTPFAHEARLLKVLDSQVHHENSGGLLGQVFRPIVRGISICSSYIFNFLRSWYVLILIVVVAVVLLILYCVIKIVLCK